MSYKNEASKKVKVYEQELQNLVDLILLETDPNILEWAHRRIADLKEKIKILSESIDH